MSQLQLRAFGTATKDGALDDVFNQLLELRLILLSSVFNSHCVVRAGDPFALDMA